MRKFKHLTLYWEVAQSKARACNINNWLSTMNSVRQLEEEETQVFLNADVYAHLLQRCIDMNCLEDGKIIHGYMIKSGFKLSIFINNRLIHMYAKCGSLERARLVFDKMFERDRYSWSVLVAAYAKWGCIEDARKLFNRMPERGSLSWNVMIAGYVEHGNFEEALKFFGEMHRSGTKRNRYTYASVLSACTGLAALQVGEQVHVDVLRTGFESNAFVGTALVDMYAKHGKTGYAHQVFDKMPERDTVTWTAMIAGYAQNKCSAEALDLFHEMQEAGTKPNQLTFSVILSACAGLAALRQGNQVHAQIITIG